MSRARPPRVLVVDIGNTSISLGLYRSGRVSRVSRMKTSSATVAAVEGWVQENEPAAGWDAAMICSVVPRQQNRWTRAVRRVAGFDPVWIDHQTDIGVPICYPKPERIGADRLANSAGAVARHGAPVIVADFGTALTFDVIGREGYLGGVIAPGLPLMLDYLHERTAKLPHLELRRPRRAIGRSTEEAMRIGADRGYRGMIRALVDDICAELDEPEDPMLIGTGGHAKRVLTGLDRPVSIEPDLTLYGLGVIHDRRS